MGLATGYGWEIFHKSDSNDSSARDIDFDYSPEEDICFPYSLVEDVETGA